MSTTIEAAPEALNSVVSSLVGQVGQEVKARAYRTANELQNQANHVLRGERSGRRYKKPGTYRRQRDPVSGKMRNGVYYTASAPGEPPANRTGAFRGSWHRKVYAQDLDGHNFNVRGVTESDLKVGTKRKYLLGDLLEDGTPTMKPRPYKQRVIDRAMPKVLRIYHEPYLRG